MQKNEIYGFENLNKAARTEAVQPLKNAIKILFKESEDMQEKNVVAIDMGNKELYLKPDLASIDFTTADYAMSDEEIKDVLGILKKYNVQEWNKKYSDGEDEENYSDGYGWNLYIQYEDGTVESHSGKGMSKVDSIPAEFDKFISELTTFVKERKK